MAKLSDLEAFKSVVNEIHDKVMADFAAYPTITNISVDISLLYTRKAGTNNAQVQIKAAERRSDYYRQSAGIVTTTT